MAKSSINIKPVKQNSERHNQRNWQNDKQYNLPNRKHLNEQKVTETIAERKKKVTKRCKEISGRKMQKNAEPIREGVVNIKEETTMEDLQYLADKLQIEFGIKAFQIYTHRDEGRKADMIDVQQGKAKQVGDLIINHHAHIVFDWTDDKTGKMIRLKKADMRRMQDITAEVLEMERGVPSNEKHLDVISYKNKQELLKAEELEKIKHKIEELNAVEVLSGLSYGRLREIATSSRQEVIFARETILKLEDKVILLRENRDQLVESNINIANLHDEILEQKEALGAILVGDVDRINKFREDNAEFVEKARLERENEERENRRGFRR